MIDKIHKIQLTSDNSPYIYGSIQVMHICINVKTVGKISLDAKVYRFRMYLCRVYTTWKKHLASTFARYHLEFGNKHNRAQMNLNPISGSHHIQASLYGSSKSSHKHIRCTS